MSWVVGVDVGGTFTDFCALNEDSGDTRLWKHPSTPANPAHAIVNGLGEMSRAHGIPLHDVRRFCHGTTVATNALIQRQGQPVTLVTTRGFKDLIEIGRQTRPHLYDLQMDHPEPLVPRERRIEVRERILADGTVRTPVSADDLAAAIDAIQEAGANAVAVCFLFSFLNPAHEREVAEKIRRSDPALRVSLSSEVQPEFREYERFTTTIINAYLQPVLDQYLGTLEAEIASTLPGASLGINQSSGGLMSAARAREVPVRTALSGPAAGAVGGVSVARAAQRPNAITMDVGGTSADVALIRDYKIDLSFGRDVGGFRIRLPMMDISSVGAGGGSIAWFDRDGLLKVGPASAGAVPGPACYGLGGRDATLSDANLVLGRLSDRLIGGSMRLDVELARTAVRSLADKMGKTTQETAFGIVDIAVANMVRAIRGLSVERGHDPRDFTLMAFGGAGPLHARDVATALGISEILIPPAPGILCAQGLVVSDPKEDFVLSGRLTCGAGVDEAVWLRLTKLMRLAGEWCRAERALFNQCSFEFHLDMRYVGQNFELNIGVANGASLSRESIPGPEGLRELFFRAHDRAYGFHNPDGAVEIVNFRLTARLPQSRQGTAGRAENTNCSSNPLTYRPVFFASMQSEKTPVHRREDLAPGSVVSGPAVIEQLDATSLIYPQDVARVDMAGNILIEISRGKN